MLGVDEDTLKIGVAAAGVNIPITGIYDPDHHQALIASLHFGCNAFASPEEVVNQATIVVCRSGINAPSGGRDRLVLSLRDGVCHYPSGQRDEAEHVLACIRIDDLELREG